MLRTAMLTRVSRRGLVTGLAASPLLACAKIAKSASLDAFLNTAILTAPANAAVFFDDGVSSGTNPSTVVTQPGAGAFAALQPHQLPGVQQTAWGYFAVAMASTKTSFETMPLFGFNGVHGQIIKVEILPAGSYSIFTSHGTQGQRLTAQYYAFPFPVLHAFVGNPNGAQSLFSHWIASLPRVLDGAKHLIEVFLNPPGGSVGVYPFPISVAIDNQLTNVYEMPGQNPSYPNGVFEIPWGNDGVNPNPSGWVAFDYPIFGGAPSTSWAQQNAFRGVLDHLYLEVATPIEPFMSQYQIMDQNRNLIITSKDGSNVLYPGQPTPAIYLHGGPGIPGFNNNHGLIPGSNPAPGSNPLFFNTTFGFQDGYETFTDIRLIDVGEGIDSTGW